MTVASNGQQKPLTPQTISPAKKPRGRPKKNLPNTSNAKARSESISGSSDSELEFEEPDEPSPLPAVRPADDEGAIQYDTIKAVWSPRNKYPSVDKIKNALVAFKDVVKAVRDEWKSLSQSMKDAENQNNNEKALELKNKVAHQRKLINTVISTTIEKGHPVIVEKYVPLSPRLIILLHCPACTPRALLRIPHNHRVTVSKWIESESRKIINAG